MPTDRDAVLATLEAFDRAFASGDADAYAGLFTPDGRMLLLYRDPLAGPAAIHADAAPFFAAWDTSAWRTGRTLVDILGDRAWVLSTYSETLIHRGERHRRLVRGRLVHVLRREPEGWRIELVMNSHSHRIEELPAADGEDRPG